MKNNQDLILDILTYICFMGLGFMLCTSLTSVLIVRDPSIFCREVEQVD